MGAEVAALIFQFLLPGYFLSLGFFFSFLSLAL
jgi:hypothetical protein